MLIALLNIAFPLPNQWVLLPLFFLVTVSSDRFAAVAPLALAYLRRDFNRGVLGGLIVTGTLTWISALIVPTAATILIVYTTLFWIMSGSIRTTFETTSFLFREEIERGVELFRAFAATRFTYFAVVPLMALTAEGITLGDAAYLMFFWTILMLPQFVTVPLMMPMSTNRPIVHYLLGDRRVELEIEVLKKLEDGPLSEKQLALRAKVPLDELRATLGDLLDRRLLAHDGRRWDLGRAYRGILLLLERKRRRQRINPP